MLLLKDRIKKLRKALDLTQQEFGERIGSTQNAIGNYETGHRNPSSSVINNICKTFNVDETWLRTGDGEMFVQTVEDPVDRLCAELHATKLDAEIVRAYFKIDERIREPFMRRLLEQVHIPTNVGKDISVPTTVEEQTEPDTSGQEQAEPDLAAKVAELERQNQEKDKQLQALASQIKDQKSRMDAAKEIEPDVQKLDGEELTTEEEEALYRSSSGYVANADLSALNTTDDTGSSGTKLA